MSALLSALPAPSAARPASMPERRRHGDAQPRLRLMAGLVAWLVQILTILAFLHSGTQAPVLERPIELMLVPDSARDKAPPTPPAKIELPPAKPVQISLPLPTVRVAEALPPARPVEAPSAEPPAASTTSTAITAAVPAPPPAAGAASDAFNAAVRAAVFAAYRVPASAREMGEFGETRIAFTLVDGAVANIRVLSPSGHALLDEAALAAARAAQYPSTPEGLRGRTLSFEIVLYSHRMGG